MHYGEHGFLPWTAIGAGDVVCTGAWNVTLHDGHPAVERVIEYGPWRRVADIVVSNGIATVWFDGQRRDGEETEYPSSDEVEVICLS